MTNEAEMHGAATKGIRSSGATLGATLRQWLATAPFPAAVVSGSGSIVAANAALTALLPPAVDAVLTVLSAADGPRFIAYLTAARSEADASPIFDVELLTASGPLPVRVGFRRVEEAGRRAEGLILAEFMPIADLHDREVQLRQDNLRWERALIGANAGVWDIDLINDEAFFSDTWKTIRGIPAGQSISSSMLELAERIHPEDREWVDKLVQEQRRGNSIGKPFEYRYLHPDGHWIWIECRGCCFEWDANGLPKRVLGTDFDVTERKRSEEAVGRLSRRLRVALEASRIGVFEADFETGLVDWDDGMFRVYGVTRSDQVVIGGLWEQMLHPEDRDRVMKKVDYHVANQLPFSDEFRIKLPDQSERFIRSRTLPFVDADGHMRMIGANWDVTDDIQLRRDLELVNALAAVHNRQLEAAKAEVERVALLDPLTELPNRRYLDKKLASLPEAHDGAPLPASILQLDLDHFKEINDTFGHGVGDKVLCHAADVLRHCTRNSDFVARIGGDEFVVVVPTCDPAVLEAMADRVIEHLNKPVSIDGNTCRIGASIGIAIGTDAGLDGRQLLLNADIALYQAKNSGRSRSAFFTVETHRRLLSARQAAEDILRGLEAREFIAYYQPQFDARSLAVAGVEALVRWQHPTRKLLTPDHFLAIADDLGVVSEIDRLVLDHAVADCAAWAREGLAIPKCSVNVSARRLQDPDLLEKLRDLPPRPIPIAFELLESIFLDEFDRQVAENLTALRQMGVEIEIDDFGSGHASIVSVLRLRPSVLKIDRRLIASVTESAEQRALVQSIIQMGHALGVRVLAEGVETSEHVEVLRALNCDLLQGYGLARPMPAGEIGAFLSGESWRAAAL